MTLAFVVKNRLFYACIVYLLTFQLFLFLYSKKAKELLLFQIKIRLKKNKNKIETLNRF